jgi:hypothetical protein
MEDKGRNWKRALTTVLLTLLKVVDVGYSGKKKGISSIYQDWIGTRQRQALSVSSSLSI